MTTNKKCDHFCEQETDFKQTINRFQQLQKKYKKSYTNYLEFRDRSTNLARKYSKDTEETEKEINGILDKLKDFYKNFNKLVKFNSGFLNRQTIKIKSKIDTIDSNDKVINNKNDRARSKQYALQNSNSLLDIRKDKIKYYTHLNIIFGSLLLVMLVYFTKIIVNRFKK